MPTKKKQFDKSLTIAGNLPNGDTFAFSNLNSKQFKTQDEFNEAESLAVNVLNSGTIIWSASRRKDADASETISTLEYLKSL